MSLFNDPALLFDIAIAVLLVVTIAYAVVLNRKLTVLRDARSSMEKLLGDFSVAVTRTEDGLAKLRAAADGSSEALQQRLEKADLLADDLALLEKRSQLAVSRLEEVLAQSRSHISSQTSSDTGQRRQAKFAIEPRKIAGDDGGERPDSRNHWREMRASTPASVQTNSALQIDALEAERSGAKMPESKPLLDERGSTSAEEPLFDERSQLYKILEGLR